VDGELGDDLDRADQVGVELGQIFRWNPQLSQVVTSGGPTRIAAGAAGRDPAPGDVRGALTSSSPPWSGVAS
jgi:hypothetical protein